MLADAGVLDEFAVGENVDVLVEVDAVVRVGCCNAGTPTCAGAATVLDWFRVV